MRKPPTYEEEIGIKPKPHDDTTDKDLLELLQQKFVALLCHNKMRHVDMSGLLWKKVPRSFCYNADCCSFVRSLDLSHNRLKKIPPALGRLVQLRKLYLMHNTIANLPDEFFKLKKVRYYEPLTLLFSSPLQVVAYHKGKEKEERANKTSQNGQFLG